jgi:hypothetical protein
MVVRRRWGWRWPLVLAALAVWGVPGTPGFFSRLVLVFPTNFPAAISIFALILISEALLVAALWHLSMGPADEDGSIAEMKAGSKTTASDFGRLATLELGVGLVLIIVPLLYWGFFSQRLSTLMRASASEAFPSLLWTLGHARRSVWIVFLFSGLAGLVLGLLRGRIFSQMRGWQSSIVTVVSLDWLYRGIVGLLVLAGSGLRYFSVLGEGAGYAGWLLLAGAILWLLLRG